MASTARHRATPAPRLWAARGLLAATTVPVGALAGCVVAAVAATAQNPGLGAAGLAVAGVPLTLRGLRTRMASHRGDRRRGRHVAGLEQVWPAAEALDASAGASVGYLDLVRLDPAVDPAEPSPAAAVALALAPVAAAASTTDSGDALVLQLPIALTEPSEARPEVVVRVGIEVGDVSVTVTSPEATTVAPEQRAAEIAQLNRLWASGTGPDTGSLRIPSAA